MYDPPACGGNGSCVPGCTPVDPDCDVAEPGGGGGGGDDDPDDGGYVTGGCAAGGGAGWLVGLIGLAGLRRRRRS